MNPLTDSVRILICGDCTGTGVTFDVEDEEYIACPRCKGLGVSPHLHAALGALFGPHPEPDWGPRDAYPPSIAENIDVLRRLLEGIPFDG